MRRTRVRWARILAVSVAVPMGLGLAGRAGGAGASRPGARLVARRVHVVMPGETLWGIARSVVGPAGDPRSVVDRIVRLNHLGPQVIQTGTRLALPPG